MHINQQLTALNALLHREWIRMFRISIQIFLTPITSTLLYFLIFGTIMGHRIGVIDGMSYTQYIAPGLIMLAVVTNAYSNVATSLYSARFQNYIEEFLVSPAHNNILLLGYTLGGVLRGLIIGSLVLFISCFFMQFNFKSLPVILLLICLVSACFALAGFTNALLASNFEDIALVPTFILAPLTYLGGVFYSVQMLPPFWQEIAYFNPILYMVSTLRAAMHGDMSLSTWLTIGMLSILILVLAKMNLYLLDKGVGLRE